VGITDFIRKQTPHLTGVVVLGFASFCGPFLGVFGPEMRKMARDTTIVNVWMEVVGIVGQSGSVGCVGLFAFMSQAYGKFMEAKDQESMIKRSA